MGTVWKAKARKSTETRTKKSSTKRFRKRIWGTSNLYPTSTHFIMAISFRFCIRLITFSRISENHVGFLSTQITIKRESDIRHANQTSATTMWSACVHHKRNHAKRITNNSNIHDVHLQNVVTECICKSNDTRLSEILWKWLFDKCWQRFRFSSKNMLAFG